MTDAIEEIRGRLWYLEGLGQGYYVTRCRETVSNKQCVRGMGHGLGGLFCKRHALKNPEVE